MEKTTPDFLGWQKRIALFLTSQTITLLGSSIVQYAIMWYIMLETKSGIMITISTVCAFVPQLIISFFAGVWADRFSRKFLIIFGDALIAVFTLALAFVFLAGYRELWLLFVIMGIRSIGQGIQTPAVSALIPQLVPQDKLMKINGLNQTIMSSMMLVSPMIAGALLSFSPLESVFFLDVVTAIIGVGVFIFIRVPRHEREGLSIKGGYFADLVEGLKYIIHSNWLLEFFIFYAMLMFAMTPTSFLTPLLVARSFGDEVWRLTANEVVFFVGTAAGGLLVAKISDKRNRMITLGIACAMSGVFMSALGIAPDFYYYLAAMSILGITMAFMQAPSMTILQERVDPTVQGRIFSVISIMQTAVMPLGMALFGFLADRMKIEWLLITTGAATVVMSLIMMTQKKLLAIGKPLEAPNAAE